MRSARSRLHRLIASRLRGTSLAARGRIAGSALLSSRTAAGVSRALARLVLVAALMAGLIRQVRRRTPTLPALVLALFLRWPLALSRLAMLTALLSRLPRALMALTWILSLALALVVLSRVVRLVCHDSLLNPSLGRTA